MSLLSHVKNYFGYGRCISLNFHENVVRHLNGEDRFYSCTFQWQEAVCLQQFYSIIFQMWNFDHHVKEAVLFHASYCKDSSLSYNEKSKSVDSKIVGIE